nr:polysaccharide biosynthesis C-terminal domain-containing protein [Pseudoalteromonas sp. NEC-BIFX-2020_015]
MILFLFGKEYQNSYLVLVIFSFCWVLRSFVGPLGTILTMTKNLKGLRTNLYMSALVIFSSCILLIPLYGAVGAAVSSLLGTVTMCITNAITVHRKLGIRFYTFNSLKLQIICLSNLVKRK